MKKRIYMVIVGLLWIVNIVIFLFNVKRMQLDAVTSGIALLPVLLMIFQAIQAYQYRHCDNLLKDPPMRRLLVLKTQISEHTYSTEYMDEFALMFAIYVGVIPFNLLVFAYILPSFQFLITGLLFFVPYIFYFVMWIRSTAKKYKEINCEKAQAEKDRLDQERREEQGYFK